MKTKEKGSSERVRRPFSLPRHRYSWGYVTYPSLQSPFGKRQNAGKSIKEREEDVLEPVEYTGNKELKHDKSKPKPHNS
jgi:hypothetical protein